MKDDLKHTTDVHLLKKKLQSELEEIKTLEKSKNLEQDEDF